MCFSATGSFAVSGLLAGLGAASLVRNDERPLRMFAAIPLMFAAQQASEGAVWLTVHEAPPSAAAHLAVAAFLAFAIVVWPLWLPWSLSFVERDPRRRRALAALSWFGALVAAATAILLMRWPPTARVAGHSIAYDFAVGVRGDSPAPIAVYLVPTILPFFVSTITHGRLMGVLLVGSLVVTLVMERRALTSVWCFFAAIVSALILVIVAREQRAASPEGQPAHGGAKR